jgi:adhesin transport system outer membrane protein
MKKLVAGMLISLPCYTSALTLEESLASAINHSPALHEQFARFQGRLELQGEARSKYYPQISVRAAVGPESTSYRSGVELDNNLTREDVTLRITQMLFAGMENVSNSDRLEKEAEADRLNLLAEAENLALKVASSYLNVRKAEILIGLTERHVQDHKDILEDVKRLAKTGYANSADIAQVTARLALANSSYIAAVNNLNDQKAEFMRIVGKYPENLIDPIADSSLLPESLDMALEWAVQYHPQLKAAMADSQAAQSEIRASQSGYYPKVFVEGVVNTGNDRNGFEGKDEDYRVQLVMEWELFNGMRDVSRSRAASWRYNEAMAIRDNAEQQLFEGTRYSWNAYQSLQQQRKYLTISVNASTLAEEGYITQFKLGRRSLLDLLNAKVEVFVARKNYLSSNYDFSEAKFRLMNATGRLGYALRVSYPGEWQSEAENKFKDRELQQIGEPQASTAQGASL